MSHSLLVAAGIFLSRLAGLARERVFAHYLGNGPAAGAFRAALRIPNFLQNLFGEGVLSASFIPVYSRLLAQGETVLAARVAGVVASLLGLCVSLLVLAGVLLTPAFVGLVAPGFEGDLRALTILLVRILFPGVGLLVLSAWCLGVLNSHRKFFLSYAAPVFWNFAMILSLVLAGSRGLATDSVAVWLAWGTVVGSALQFAVQVPFVLKHAGRIPLGAGADSRGLAPVREVFRNLGPVVVGRGVVQVSAYIDGMIASFLGAAAVSGLGYAQTLYLLPVSLFGMAVAASELPEMSSTLGTPEEVRVKLRARIDAGLRKIAFFVIPSCVGFWLLGRYLVAALFQTGQFGERDTLYVWYLLVGSTGGLLAATWGRLYSSAFYALRDTRTPLRFAIARVILTASLGAAIAFPLRPHLVAFLYGVLGLPQAAGGGEIGLGAVGLTASSGFVAWVEYALLRRALARRIGPLGLPLAAQARLWGAAIAAGGVAALVARALPPMHPVFTAGAAVGIFGVVYLGAGLALGLPEAKRLLRRVAG